MWFEWKILLVTRNRSCIEKTFRNEKYKAYCRVFLGRKLNKRYLVDPSGCEFHGSYISFIYCRCWRRIASWRQQQQLRSDWRRRRMTTIWACSDRETAPNPMERPSGENIKSAMVVSQKNLIWCRNWAILDSLAKKCDSWFPKVDKCWWIYHSDTFETSYLIEDETVIH